MDIKIFITQNNLWCKKLKTWMKRKRLAFEILDLDESAHARDELLEKTNQLAIPMTDINGEIVIGFQQEKIEELLKKYKNS